MAKRLAERKVFPLLTMESRELFYQDGTRYAQAFSMTRYLIHHVGRERVTALFVATKESRDFEASLHASAVSIPGSCTRVGCAGCRQAGPRQTLVFPWISAKNVLVKIPEMAKKSSLVKAGLLPRLADHVSCVFVEAARAKRRQSC